MWQTTSTLEEAGANLGYDPLVGEPITSSSRIGRTWTTS